MLLPKEVLLLVFVFPSPAIDAAAVAAAAAVMVVATHAAAAADWGGVAAAAAALAFNAVARELPQQQREYPKEKQGKDERDTKIL